MADRSSRPGPWSPISSAPRDGRSVLLRISKQDRLFSQGHWKEPDNGFGPSGWYELIFDYTGDIKDHRHLSANFTEWAPTSHNTDPPGDPKAEREIDRLLRKVLKSGGPPAEYVAAVSFAISEFERCRVALSQQNSPSVLVEFSIHIARLADSLSAKHRDLSAVRKELRALHELVGELKTERDNLRKRLEGAEEGIAQKDAERLRSSFISGLGGAAASSLAQAFGALGSGMASTLPALPGFMATYFAPDVAAVAYSCLQAHMDFAIARAIERLTNKQI